MRSFSELTAAVTRWAGSGIAFLSALAIIILWFLTGPLFSYSDTWQLVINTGTTIITFLMVFLIQHTQNKDMKATQIKLDELLASSHASNRIINIEELSDGEIDRLYARYKKLRRSGKDRQSIEDSE